MAYVGTAQPTGDDLTTLASILQGEAGNQGTQGMQAVANVIANRAASNFGGNGTGLIAQATARNQFQGQAKPSAAALGVAAQLLDGTLPDITGGATSYANPSVSTATWAKNLNDTNALKIGDHYFTDNQNGRPFVGKTADQDQSTYGKVKATMAAQIPPQQLTNLVSAYETGQMDPTAKSQFEEDVHNGTIVLPSYLKIGGAPTQPNAPQPVMLPQSAVDAYNAGAINPYDKEAMPEEARHQIDEDLKSGDLALPSGAVLNQTYMGYGAKIKEAVTGSLRSTPETQNNPNYYDMPEENQGGAAGIKTAVGSTLATDPAEIVKIIKANNPDVQVSQDEKGNYLLKSAIDGKTYAIKPGMDAADLTKIVAAVAPFVATDGASGLIETGGKTLAGQVAKGAVAAGGTQAALEGAKAAAGGNPVSLGSIAVAGALGGAAPVVGKVASAAYRAVRPGAQGAADATAAGAEASAAATPPSQAPSAAPSAPAAKPVTSAADLAADAAQGDADIAARERLAALNAKPKLTTAEQGERAQLQAKIAADENAPAPEPAPEANAAPKQPAGEPAPASAPEAAPSSAEAAEQPATSNAETPPPTPLQSAVSAVTKEDQANVAGLVGKASRGDQEALAKLNTIIQPNEHVLQAAKELGTEQYLDPGMISDNPAFRQIQGGLSTIQGSGASTARIANIAGQAQKAHDVMQMLEGTQDISGINAQARQILQDAHTRLDNQAESAYRSVADKIPPTEPTPATNTLAEINAEAQRLGGADALSPEEKMILKRLSPTTSETPAPEPPTPDPQTGKISRQQFQDYLAQRQAWEDSGGSQEQAPTYHRVDAVRRDIGAAIGKNQGPFKDADRARLNKLYNALTEDQGATAARNGALEDWKVGKEAIAQRKAIEARMQKLFGKNLDGAMNAQLSQAGTALAKGDASKLVNLLKAMPDEMKQRVTATALYSAMTNGQRGEAIGAAQFTKFFEGLTRNKQVYNAVMSNLPEGAAKQLNNLYTIFSSIARANEDVVKTGVIQGLTPQFQGPDSLLSKLYGAAGHAIGGGAKHGGMAAVIGHAVGHVVGSPEAGAVLGGLAGVGKGVISALRGEAGKPEAIKAVDKLISSPEFRDGIIKHASGDTQGGAAVIAHSRPMRLLTRALGNPREMTNREKWILNALQATNTTENQ